jgi:Flp pilus assembly protein TadD
VQVRYVLGSVLWNAGRRQAALAEFEAAHSLAPRDETVAAALAVVRTSLSSRTGSSSK